MTTVAVPVKPDGFPASPLKPALSSYLNLEGAIEGNLRPITPPQVQKLAEAMREKIRDVEFPILVYVESKDLASAKEAASKGLPFPYRILVMFLTVVSELYGGKLKNQY
jgi:hypothetical protein